MRKAVFPSWLNRRVASLLRDVAEEAVMPRFRALAAYEVAEKSPGEVVTIADRDAEARLYHGLEALGLGARIVGEEAVACDPSLLDDVGEGLVWLIDPLDGTANFAAGRMPFGMMVALVEDGETLAGWILDPVGGALFHAERGKGARCNGVPMWVDPPRRRHPRAALGTHFLPEARRAQVHARAERAFDVVPVPRCAAASYPLLVAGQDDIVLFQRTLPWDHAAGTLFVSEAGGVATHWNGEPYRVGGEGIGVLAAASQEHWRHAAEVLLAPEAGLSGLSALPLPAPALELALP
jgi:fructose-1,6-bisphosphatase/inositol monophosphatase family enzyme